MYKTESITENAYAKLHLYAVKHELTAHSIIKKQVVDSAYFSLPKKSFSFCLKLAQPCWPAILFFQRALFDSATILASSSRRLPFNSMTCSLIFSLSVSIQAWSAISSSCSEKPHSSCSLSLQLRSLWQLWLVWQDCWALCPQHAS